MANDIQLKRSSVAGRVPDAANVLVGEPVVNLTDKIIFTKDGGGNVIVIGAGTTSNVTEGSNLYFSNARVSTAVSSQTLSNATFSSDVNVRGELYVTGAAGDEGGQINLAGAVTNTTLSGQIVIDVYQNKLRFFEKGGTNRGAYIDLSTAGASAGTSLISSGTGTITSVAGVSSGAVSNAQLVTATVTSQTLTNATFSANVTADRFIAVNNGNSENYRVGDDIWIGDYNNANSMKLKGAQDSTQAYISFGASDSATLGRSGLGALTYSAGFAAANVVSTGNISAGNAAVTNSLTAGTFQTTGNVNSQNGLVSGSLTAGTLQTAGNVNANNLRVVTNSSVGTVVSGTWNGSSISTTYTDAKIVSVSNTAPISATTAAGAVTVGLLTSGVTAGTYGSATSEGVFTVDAYGRITSASNVTSSVAIGSQVTGLGTNVANFLAYPTSANLISVVTDETGSGSLVFATTPTLVTPVLGLATGTSAMLSANIGAAAGNVSGNFTAGNFQSAGNVNAASALFTGAVTAGSFQTTGLITGNINLRTEASDYARIYSDVVGATSNLVLDISDDVNADAIVLRHTHFSFVPLALDMASFKRKDNTNATIAFAGDLSVTANVSTANIIATSTSRLGTVTSGTWNGTAIGTAYGGTGLTSLGTGIATFLGSNPTSANLATLITDETGSGSLVFATTPTLVTPVLGLATGTSIMLSANIGAAAGNVSGNFTAGNFQTSGNVNMASGLATGAITAPALQATGNINTAAGLVSGNFTAGNFQTAGNVNIAAGLATGNFTAGNFQTAGNVNTQSSLVTGSLTAGTLQTAGNVNAAAGLVTGNFTASNLQTTGNTNMAAGLATGNFTAGNFQTAGNVNASSLLVTNGATLSGNVNITGNLNVTGAVTTYTSNTVEIADTIIYLATGNSGDVQDIGFVGHFTNPGYQHTGLVRDASDGVWKLFANVATEPSANTLDFTTATYSALTMGALSASTGTFSGTVAATSSNVNTASALFTGSATAGTFQTTGNVNANNLRVVTNSSLGTVVQGTWNGSSISTTYTDAKVTTVAGSTGAISNAMILSALLTVDGTGSALDADYLDGQHASYYLDTSSTAQTKSGNLTLVGTLSATTKSFVIKHPTKEGMQLRYGSLEGPENGVYVRGKLEGTDTIILPDYWVNLIDPDSITVQLSSIGKYQKLFVENIANNTITVGIEEVGKINCFYTVFAERSDVAKLLVEF